MITNQDMVTCVVQRVVDWASTNVQKDVMRLLDKHLTVQIVMKKEEEQEKKLEEQAEQLKEQAEQLKRFTNSSPEAAVSSTAARPEARSVVLATSLEKPHPADAWDKTITVSNSSRPIAAPSKRSTSIPAPGFHQEIKRQKTKHSSETEKKAALEAKPTRPCSSCSLLKKKHSFVVGEWNKGDGERVCQVCIKASNSAY